MGYYTFYDLEVNEYNNNRIGKKVTNEIILANIKNFLNKKQVIGYALDEYFCGYDQVKWYDHDDDMIELSKEFPDLIFHLRGDGEAGDDWWDKYYQNGTYQICMAEVPPFDPLKLRLYK